MDQVRKLTRNPMGQPVMPSVLEPVHRPTDLGHKEVIRTGGWRKGPKGAANREENPVEHTYMEVPQSPQPHFRSLCFH